MSSAPASAVKLLDLQLQFAKVNQQPDQIIVPVADLPQYKRCLCLGVQSGRTCQLCFGMRWLRRCLSCFGSGLIFKPSRTGAEPKSERCGFCMGKGWIGAKSADKEAISLQESGVKEIKREAGRVLTGQQQQQARQSGGRRSAGASAGTAPAKRRGRQPSAESLAKLAARTGEPQVQQQGVIPPASAELLTDHGAVVADIVTG